jgi:hypothetical protein
LKEVRQRIPPATANAHERRPCDHSACGRAHRVTEFRQRREHGGEHSLGATTTRDLAYLADAPGIGFPFIFKGGHAVPPESRSRTGGQRARSIDT